MEYFLELKRILLLNFQRIVELGLESISHSNRTFVVKLSIAIIDCDV
jgi:hypothetical protein